MLQELKQNKLDYSLLAILAASFSFYFLLNRHRPTSLFVATLLFAIFYVIWGVWHHSKSHHLTWRIVLEYFLVAALGLSLVSTLLL